MSTANLPTWEQMTDLDKGAALLHLHKCNWEGAEYAVENYPAEYLDDPRLTALDSEEASEHAAGLFGDEDPFDVLSEAEYDRLYDLALDADRKRTQAQIHGGAK